MKQDDKILDDLFDSARVEINSEEFTRRVMVHIALPPSRNFYRVPTLVASLASVMLILVCVFKGVEILGFAHDVSANYKARRQAVEQQRVDKTASKGEDGVLKRLFDDDIFTPSNRMAL